MGPSFDDQARHPDLSSRPTRRWTDWSRHKPRGSDPVGMGMTSGIKDPYFYLSRRSLHRIGHADATATHVKATVKT
jgi:hypothetical protein